jgi:hypothetical protein|tara:strand:+ start:5155 stop:6840 length:1686 start_codon:yes stop_codon:yes gene_type:complete
VSCLDEPDYIDTKKSDFPEPSNIWIEQLDAFSLRINWKVPKDNYNLVDGFIIETLFMDETIIANEFDTYKDVENNYRKLILYLSDSSLTVLPEENDSIPLFFIDDSASFKQYNYYRITIFNREVESYSVTSDSGIYFDLISPDNFTIDQLNDYQLKLSWNNSNFSDGYTIERILASENDSIVFYTTDSTLTDSSYNPSNIILADSLSVDGLQPNKDYIYSIYAFAEKDGYSKRKSNKTANTGILNLMAPIIADSIALNISSIRLYIADNTFIDKFDTLFVLKKDNVNWECVDTLLINSLDQIKFNGQYLVDIQTSANADFKLVVKGKINALASNIVTETPLDLAGFTFVEGGNFIYSVTNNDTNITSFYISNYEFTGIANFPSEKGNFPEDNISWVDAVLICSTLNNQYGNEYSFRLPSEEEWEYAASWDIFLLLGFDYPWQSNSISGNNANYMNSGDPFDNGITPTGYYNGSNVTIDSFSSFGVYDMGGNILEWCGSGNLNDDLNEISGSSYIGNDSIKPMRGGGYWHSPNDLKTTDHFSYGPEIHVPGFGFRIVMEVIE